ncbi:conserved hypothetical protein [Weissella viridescens]|nr:conserved hypothetical protein [Weissella viridescens]
MTCPATEIPVSEASNFVISPIPTCPSIKLSKYVSAVFPIGVIAPNPVITTLVIFYTSIVSD